MQKNDFVKTKPPDYVIVHIDLIYEPPFVVSMKPLYATARTDGGDADAALATVNEAYVTVQKKLDRAGARNLIHRNKAARTKSRLQARIKKAKA